eukprot:symbB.v1.2.025192.t1/scaffold2433.1/size79213/6
MVCAVFECAVLLSLILVHHFPTMPVLWMTYCGTRFGTVAPGVLLPLGVSLWTIWRITSPREDLEEEEEPSALSPIRRRSSRRFQDVSSRFNTTQRLHQLEEPLLSRADWEESEEGEEEEVTSRFGMLQKWAEKLPGFRKKKP